MTKEQKDLFTKTVRRLERMHIYDPTGQIVYLAEEIEQCRAKIHHLEEALREATPKPYRLPFSAAIRPPERPKEQRFRYTHYDADLECFVVPCLRKLDGKQITFYQKTPRGSVPLVWGDAIDRLAEYENQEEANE